MLNIIHFSQDFRSDKPQLGGYSRILNLCRDGNRHFIFTISFKLSKISEFEIENNIRVIEIPLFRNDFRLRYQLFGLKFIANRITNYLSLNNIPTDLFFGHSQLVNFFILKKVRKILGVKTPLIWEMNAIWGHREINNRTDILLLPVERLVLGYILRKADHIIAHSNESKKYVSEQYPEIIAKLSVITNAVIPQEIVEGNQSFSSKKPRKFICLGFFDGMNGIPLLIDCIRKKKLEIEISFFGNGLYRNDVEALAKEGRCKYQGAISRNEMMAILGEFDFVIIPRLRLKEADLFIPTKLIEAMANGVVPICSDVRGMTEVIRHGENGLIFSAGNLDELSDLIQQALKIPDELLKDMKKSAITTVRNEYNWDNNHTNLRKIYDNLIS